MTRCLGCGHRPADCRCRFARVGRYLRLPAASLDEGLSYLLAVEVRAEARDHGGWRA